jgi:secreted trypsin-like serine protease
LIGLALPAAILGRQQAGFIVGGDDAEEGAWPWQLSLRSGGSHSCGASLVGAGYAVCAAHCVGGLIATYTVVAGTNQRSCSDNNCRIVRLTEAIRHPDFVNSGVVGYPNDISVLKFDTNLDEVEGKIKYAPITTNEDWVGSECYITGWGRLTGGGILPENLQQALIDILTTAECQGMWSAAQVRDSQVCIYDRATQARGACNGDSGGPLVCRSGPDAPWELVGATSWGRTGCATTSPSVYTRVSSFKDWIEQQAQ